jgi:integrase
VDWDNKLWTLTADRMKQGRPHQVPLSDRAMAILRARHERSVPRGAQLFVFTGYNRTQLSAKSMAYILRAMGLGVTVHGFRSTFRDWCGDCTEFQREHVESCLGHLVGNATERAYRRSDALEKRRAILQSWCEFCHDSR